MKLFKKTNVQEKDIKTVAESKSAGVVTEGAESRYSDTFPGKIILIGKDNNNNNRFMVEEIINDYKVNIEGVHRFEPNISANLYHINDLFIDDRNGDFYNDRWRFDVYEDCSVYAMKPRSGVCSKAMRNIARSSGKMVKGYLPTYSGVLCGDTVTVYSNSDTYHEVEVSESIMREISLISSALIGRDGKYRVQQINIYNGCVPDSIEYFWFPISMMGRVDLTI